MASSSSSRPARGAARPTSLHADTPLELVRGIGPVRAGQLKAAGLLTVGDLLFHLPFRYEDRRTISTAASLPTEGAAALVGKLSGLAAVRVRKRGLSLVRGRFEDATGSLPVVWFNRPYLPGWVRPGTEYLLYGDLRRSGSKLELVNPSCEPAAEAVHGARIVPVYSQAGEVGPALLRRLFAELLPQVDWLAIPEPLPAELLERRGLLSLPESLRQLHLPAGEADVALLNAFASPAHTRLVFGELLELQLRLAQFREQERASAKPHRYQVDDAVRQAAREVLPFRLTGAQRRVLKEIVDDLQAPQPMLRLLQGDVGSGKTVVAALAMVVALESGLQAAFMAPTELLAEQHFRTLSKVLGGRYRLALLTGSQERSAAAESRAAVERGEVQVVVGTHALIESRVSFARLGLAVIDEQHRFGVGQRQGLEAKGARPDLLVMTATPIPRSLALTAYGDLAISVLDELPPGRRPIATEVLPAGSRKAVYARLRRELEGGARAYVVFPLIEESELVEAEAVAALGRKIQEELAPIPSELLHGQLPAEERERILRAFAAGEIQALLATTVIEVGIDVPEATVMVIESAERFGLSQLHQLRGRVGRGSAPSRCIALHGKLSAEAQRRLEVFAASQDGFRIAEADLEIRGPGDLLGTRQAGLPRLRVANLLRDQRWLEAAREEARRLLPLLARDPALAPLARLTHPSPGEREARWGGG
ncbi:MAG TPA: ATP-dependent DNA helicase RecG [Thermoanaerobaculia bacterium]|nr:ATP-dependent DNA helicase RecG [Thermoanaerobaculia bacterium]